MNIYKFIKENKHQIQNIDGSVDGEATITLLEPNGMLSFHFFGYGSYIEIRYKKQSF
jgi:hypothetical protein